MSPASRGPQIDRRSFLAGLSASAALGAIGGAQVEGSGTGFPPPGMEGGETPRIRALFLETTTPLEEMVRFYHGGMGLPVLAERAESVTFQAGASALTFRQVGGNEAPFYHFAFNIPEDKILPALAWQRQRAEILPALEHLRDPEMPDEVVHFSHWNAHSIFFWDPAGNLVEHIARHDLDNASPGPFGPEDVLYASEIAFIVDDVPAAAGELREAFGLPQYRQASRVFAAVGDERGLLLVMIRGRMLGQGAGKPASVFPTRAEIADLHGRSFRFEGYPYEVSATDSAIV